MAVAGTVMSMHKQMHEYKSSQQDILQRPGEVCSMFGDKEETDYHQEADEQPKTF